MRTFWLGLALAVVIGCESSSNPQGAGISSPPVPALPGVPAIPSANVPAIPSGPVPTVPIPTVAAFDTPQVVMEKMELAKQTGDWNTCVALLTPETHDRLVAQEVLMQVLHIHNHRKFSQAAVNLDDDPALQPLKAHAQQIGLPWEKMKELSAIEDDEERKTAILAAVRQMPNRQAFATELWSRSALKAGFRPQAPREKPPIEVSGAIESVNIQGDVATVNSRFNVGGVGGKHQTILRLTPLGWRIDLSKSYF